MQIIDGKALSAKYREKLKSEIQSLKSRGVTPGLAVILVGDDPGSQVYVRNKIKACEELGITGFECRYPADTDEKTVIAKIDELNANPDCDGILVQLPLPRHLDERKILSYIDVKKDVDGFSAYQTGLMCLGTPDLLPCTPHGVIELIKSTGVEIAGKNAVVIGRSNIVGKPMFHLLLQNLSNLDQHLVTHIMSVGIIDFLKEINITYTYAETFIVKIGIKCHQSLHSRATIKKSCQWIRICLLLKHLIVLNKLTLHGLTVMAEQICYDRCTNNQSTHKQCSNHKLCISRECNKCCLLIILEEQKHIYDKNYPTEYCLLTTIRIAGKIEHHYHDKKEGLRSTEPSV